MIETNTRRELNMIGHEHNEEREMDDGGAALADGRTEWHVANV